VATRAVRAARAHRVAYRRIVVPLAIDGESDVGISLAAELAAEARASITAVIVIEVAPELPLEAHMEDEEAAARTVLEKARAIAAHYGVRLRAQVIRSRARGEAIVAEAEAAGADLIVVVAPRTGRPGRHMPLFGKTVDYVLRHASCRVLVAAPQPDR
jgi:nucleotide-binding universal stress UspA family protein